MRDYFASLSFVTLTLFLYTALVLTHQSAPRMDRNLEPASGDSVNPEIERSTANAGSANSAQNTQSTSLPGEDD